MLLRPLIVLCVLIVLSFAVSAQEQDGEKEVDQLQFPTVIIEGRELMKISPAERVISTYGHSPKLTMPEKLRDEHEMRYFYVEGAGGSNKSGMFGGLGKYRKGEFALDVETRFLSTDGSRDDDVKVFEQDASLLFGPDEGPSLRLKAEYGVRALDLLGADWYPLVDDARDTQFGAVSAVFSGELLADTTMDITMSGEETVIDDDHLARYVYKKTCLQTDVARGIVTFGFKMWKHELRNFYTADEIGAFLSIEDALLGEGLIASAGVKVQDYGDNGASADPWLEFGRPVGWGWSWKTVFLREMVIKDFHDSYGIADYTKVNPTQFKPERKVRLETSFSKVVRRNLSLTLYGFGEDWRKAAVWDHVGEAGDSKGFYTLRQIEGYQLLGTGARAELDVRHGFRLFVDAVLRDTEKDADVNGVIPFMPAEESEFGAEFEIGRLTAVFDGSYKGRRYYDVESNAVMAETVGIGGRLEYATRDATFFLEGRNLARSEYLDVAGYPTAEASWMLGMRLFF